jgi:hypothetical protein
MMMAAIQPICASFMARLLKRRTLRQISIV